MLNQQILTQTNKELRMRKDWLKQSIDQIKPIKDTARYHLMLYAEHTWGYSSSVFEPYPPLVNNPDQRKALYAAKAHEAVSRCYDGLCENRG